MNKRIAFCFLIGLSVQMSAQNVWESPESLNKKEVVAEDNKHKDNKTEEKTKKQKAEKPNPDAKYLEGAVPEVNGMVEWSTQIKAPGKSAQQLYDISLEYLKELTSRENQLEGSKIALVNRNEHKVVATIKEWIIFKKQVMSLDRTKLNYALMFECQDNSVTVTMNRISFKYEEEREGGGYYKAEEWIADKYALNKKKTKLIPGSAKFRRKTVDRKDELFKEIEEYINKR